MPEVAVDRRFIFRLSFCPSIRPFVASVISQECLYGIQTNLEQLSTLTQGWTDSILPIKDEGHCDLTVSHSCTGISQKNL